MTLAPRTEVITQLACDELRSSRHPHTTSFHNVSAIHPNLSISQFPGFAVIDTPSPFILDQISTVPLVEAPTPSGGDKHEKDDLSRAGNLPLNCTADPAVQAGAAKRQTST